MIVHVQAEAVELREVEDLKRFRVDAFSSSPSSLVQALSAARAGRFESGHAWIDPAFIEQHARASDPQQWALDFAGMLNYARSKGFTAPDGFLRAHVEWV